MRRHLILLVFLCFFYPAPGHGATVLAGRVVSLDRGGGAFVLHQAGTDRMVAVAADPARIPRMLAVGAQVRVWGVFHPADPTRFQAHQIVMGGAPGGLKTGDPTGVRSRLYRGTSPPIMEGFR